MEKQIDDGCLRLFNFPPFNEKGKDYVMRDMTTHGRRDSQAKIRSESQFEGKFDGVGVNCDEYLTMKESETNYLMDGPLNLFGHWIMQNSSLPMVQDVGIIPLFIATQVTELFDYLKFAPNYDHVMDAKLHRHLEAINKYLYGHPNLLQKHLLFFCVNQNFHHWFFGYCAVNAWQAIVRDHRNKEPMHLGLHKDFTYPQVMQHKSGILRYD